MNLMVEHVPVWAANIEDKPGELAAILSALSDAGASLESVISRRAPEAPGKGVVFVTPLRSDREIDTATQLGFTVTHTLHSVRVQGLNRPGMAAWVTQQIAGAGINLRGFSASIAGSQFIAYAAVDTLEDAQQIVTTLQQPRLHRIAA